MARLPQISEVDHGPGLGENVVDNFRNDADHIGLTHDVVDGGFAFLYTVDDVGFCFLHLLKKIGYGF